MPARVKAVHRQIQAEETKDRIAAEARRLFSSGGYGSTSIEAIAGAAGVAVRTIYAAFGTKREILSRICENWLRDAGARERAEAVLADPDPESRLVGTAAWLTRLYAVGLDVAVIFDAATDESPETRDLLRAKLAGRDQVLDAMTATLGEVVASVPEARAVLKALATPGVYRSLVVEAGWSTDDFTAWVVGVLRRPTGSGT
ncbi:MAG: TetR/AcrR family transcriptional regulator [Nakamurella sp.]